MHSLIGFLSILSFAVFLIWRVTGTVNALHQTGNIIGDLASQLRRWSFRRKAEPKPLSSIEDPREAALVLMVAIMKDRGALTEEQLQDLENWAENRLQFSNGEEMVARARWHARPFCESGAVLYRLAKPLAQSCNGAQRADVIDLVVKAAHSGGGQPTTLQVHTIKELRYKLGDTNQATYNPAI